jgi:hypothetical protein
MEKKLRLSVYLDPDVMHLLADYAERRNQPRSMIAEAAISSFLSPDSDERREAASVKRLDRLDRRIHRLERDLGVAVEALAVFVLFWLASTPQLPDSIQAATRSKAHERYSSFLEALGRRLAAGPTLRQEVGEDIQGQYYARHGD